MSSLMPYQSSTLTPTGLTPIPELELWMLNGTAPSFNVEMATSETPSSAGSLLVDDLFDFHIPPLPQFPIPVEDSGSSNNAGNPALAQQNNGNMKFSLEWDELGHFCGYRVRTAYEDISNPRTGLFIPTAEALPELTDIASLKGLLTGLEKWQKKLQGRLKSALKRNHDLLDQLRTAQARRTKYYELRDVSVAFAQFVNSLPHDD